MVYKEYHLADSRSFITWKTYQDLTIHYQVVIEHNYLTNNSIKHKIFYVDSIILIQENVLEYNDISTSHKQIIRNVN